MAFSAGFVETNMRERQILFSAPMVRALLAGVKTQTRRALKPQPEPSGEGSLPIDSPYGQPGDRLRVRETFLAYGRWEIRYNDKKARDEWRFVDMTLECNFAYQYAADGVDRPLAKGRGTVPAWHLRPALFMPNVASRILLEVTSVRVERLQEISDSDALAEGCSPSDIQNGERLANAYARVWESINGPGSWDADPWVWVVTFRRIG